ncbi:hypothetical protein CC86DRAFT_304707 [Ophiobolus disseminans]|uniref:Rhodopsin domain-containing protein n=1 Tax=Ophiobolus disseminans TaxID=1469910 RepID=A0A6A6ZJP9_9PLEO|nr:hypothetical protein CC86DRAFT_304707 [Ophiobolus disseminans]
MVNTTLFIHHLFTGLALIIMAVRLSCRRILFSKLGFGDFCTMAAMLCAAARGGMIHVVITWGTNNVSAKARTRIDFTPDEVYRRTIGSRLTIANRPVYNTYLWLQKLVLLHFFLRNFHPQERNRRYILWSYSVVFFATWTAAQIVGFTECDPFNLYWQVIPAPGKCVQAQVQLVVLGVLNIVTDIMLLALPLPTLISLQTPWRTKLRLFTICALGLFIIAITIIRLPINHLNAAVQANRSTWASTELLTAAIAVNAPTLYGAFNHWRRRSKNTTYGSASHPGNFSSTRAISSSLKPMHPNGDPYSDEQSMLYTQFQTSVGSAGVVQDGPLQEGIILKTMEVSHNDMGRLDAAKTHSVA